MVTSKLRNISIFVLATAMTCAFPLAQAQEEAPSEDEEVVLDTVEVTGIQDDAAMAAFRAGDFETAEVEFLDNAMCALRRERNRIASIEGAGVSADRAEVFANSGAIDSGASSRGAGASSNQQVTTGIADTSGITATNVQTNFDRTCEARARQLYFAGLSQIQLGKTNEALRNFEKATSASKILFDAHYKIGLINLLQGNTSVAEAELNKIEGILERCRDCEAKQEIKDRIDHLAKAIGGDVSMQ